MVGGMPQVPVINCRVAEHYEISKDQKLKEPIFSRVSSNTRLILHIKEIGHTFS